MQSVQITLDDDLVKAIDSAAKKLQITRSDFAGEALRKALNQNLSNLALEQKHRQGYKNNPVGKDEFSVWENEQVWGNE